MQAKRGVPAENSLSTKDFGLLLALIPSDDRESSDEDEDATREVYLLTIRFVWTQAQKQMGFIMRELPMLLSQPSSDDRQRTAIPVDETWRLDRPTAVGGPDGKGPLLDPKGKVRHFLAPISHHHRL